MPGVLRGQVRRGVGGPLLPAPLPDTVREEAGLQTQDGETTY